ncbi:MFS transporter [Amorphus sp. 3PC139-8]|uniref:MFS transporter n=1 Tax=Amorphus sp. 3PC139-8 TaxID=2735676 RepID=UPI00345D0C22
MSISRLRPSPLLMVNLSAFFSFGFVHMVALATPMWGSHLGLSAALIGLAASCRSASPFVYAIHIGSLLDIVGVRRVLIFFSLQCALLPLLYPLLPSDVPFLVLQIFLGLACAMAWIAAQTAVARTAGGDAQKTAWFSFFASVGAVIGPLALGGVWAWLGADRGYGFLALWGAGLLASSLALSKRAGIVRPRLKAAHFVPRLGIYRQAIASLKQPVIAFVMACAFVRLGAVAIVESFMPLLVQDRGFSPAVIGTLFALGNLVASPSSLLTSQWLRICGTARRALLMSVAVSAASLVAVPFVSGLAPLGLAMIGYGFGIGIGMPVTLTLLSQNVDADQQGMTAGMRATANRLGALVVPIMVGLLAELSGVATAFWTSGLILLLTLFVTGVTLGRRS